MPPRALFGFKFLLVFVFGTIPCAIYLRWCTTTYSPTWTAHDPRSPAHHRLISHRPRRGGAEGPGGGDEGKAIEGELREQRALGWARRPTATRGARGGAGGALGASRAWSRRRPCPAVAAWRRRSSDTEPANTAAPPGSFTSLSLIEWLVAMESV